MFTSSWFGGGNTTRKAIINVLNRLSAEGKRCCSSAEPVNNIRHAYDYLIHDTGIVPKEGQGTVPSRSPHRGEQLRHRAA